MEFLVLAGEGLLLLDGLLVEMFHLLEFGVDRAEFALSSLQLHVELVDANLRCSEVKQIV